MYCTLGFVACKFDSSENGCISLHTLSHRAIFIADREAKCLSTLDFPELQQHAISFVEHHYYKDEQVRICHDMNGNIYGRSIDWLLPNAC